MLLDRGKTVRTNGVADVELGSALAEFKCYASSCLFLPQAANLKIEKRSMLQNTPQEFFTSVLTLTSDQKKKKTKRLKDHSTLAQINSGKVTTRHNSRTEKHQQCILFFLSTHIFQPPVGLLVPARGKQRCECVFVCI